MKYLLDLMTVAALGASLAVSCGKDGGNTVPPKPVVTEDMYSVTVHAETAEVQNRAESQRNEELFHFVHPEFDDKEAWLIHDAVKRVVKRQGIQEICQYLTLLKNEKKVLLPQAPAVAYAELVRMGMPSGEGFNEITFRKYYNKK